MTLQSASISRTSDTLVFAPTFNERETIGPLLDGLLGLPERVDVLIVDDLSCDGTAEYLTARAATDPRLQLIMRPGKLGVGSAHKLAWLQAREHGYSRLVTLDADLSHDPQDVSRPYSTGVQMLRSDRGFCRVAVLTTAAGVCS
jgi:glycosyltransferase involved in cell wall biosynthesis